MAEKPLETYLNDHLAGAMLGTNLADQIQELAGGSALADTIARISDEVEADRQTLLDLMQRLDADRNHVKQATAWVAEKASRIKFSGLSSGDSELGTFMALESLALGVLGKRSLWVALAAVQNHHPELAGLDLDHLIARADEQHATLERERVAAARRAMNAEATATH